MTLEYPSVFPSAASFTSVAAKKNSDGSTTIYFGCDASVTNYPPIVEGWNYVVRV